jgi:adenine phosphoribosyltransferase
VISSQREDAGLAERVRRTLRDVPDFPKPGIVFKDITPVLADATLFVAVTAAMAAPFATAGITHVAGIESRGFILAAPVAQTLGAGFLPIRKPGKLPWRTRGRDYALEYGTDRLEMHADACPPGARVLLVDDVLATGGTAAAACALIEDLDGTVAGCSFLLTIAALRGVERLGGRELLDDVSATPSAQRRSRRGARRAGARGG